MNIKYPMKEKPKRGRPAIGPGPEANKVLKLYAEGFSIREVGAVLKMDPGAVRRRLKVATAEVRTKGRHGSKLGRLDQTRLFGAIAAFGVRSTAARWGLNERTLKYYLAGLWREMERKQ